MTTIAKAIEEIGLAAKIVAPLKGEIKREVFAAFTRFFDLKDCEGLTAFAKLCGFGIAVDIKRA